jgi:hypothetical protein
MMLWITQNDVPRLQSSPAASNPICDQETLLPANNAISIYNTQFFPRSVPNPNYPGHGDTRGSPVLTVGDKAVIRNVFMQWANDAVNARTTGGDHPLRPRVMNDAQSLPSNLPYRMATNNDYLGHALQLTPTTLSIEPGDDPPLDASVPASQVDRLPFHHE